MIEINIHWEDGSVQKLPPFPDNHAIVKDFRESDVFERTICFGDSSLNMRKALHIYFKNLDK
jgi:hypothetical protein